MSWELRVNPSENVYKMPTIYAVLSLFHSTLVYLFLSSSATSALDGRMAPRTAAMDTSSELRFGGNVVRRKGTQQKMLHLLILKWFLTL